MFDIIVNSCQRCGKTHKVIFKKLDNPTDKWEYWGICSNTGQPVMLHQIEQKGKIKEYKLEIDI